MINTDFSSIYLKYYDIIDVIEIFWCTDFEGALIF